MKTSWDLSLFYDSPQDPQIERDMRAYEKAHQSFARRFKSGSFVKSARVLREALEAYEKLARESIKGERAILYFFYRRELDSGDSEADSKIAQFSDRLTRADNEVLFFPLAIGKIPKAKQKAYLADANLADYHYLLEKLFRQSTYQLSEAEEKILSLKARPAYGMWIDGVEKQINQLVVTWKGKELPIEEAFNMLGDLKTQERRKLHALACERLKDAAHFSESEVNAVFTNKKIDDELRGFKKLYSATVLGYENDEQSVEALVASVSERFDISKEFFKVKKELLGLSELTYADRMAPVGKVTTTYDFKKSAALLEEALTGLGDEYAAIFKRMLSGGQIDVFPKRGKSGGAYCSGTAGLPTMVLLNHVPSLRSYTTLAHEMGHAIHSELSKTQPILYQGYSTSVAETASTFFETFAFNRIFESLPAKEQVAALHDKIESDVSSIFRQIAFFNFEKKLHALIRRDGFVPKERIASLLNEHMHACMGKAVCLDDRDGYFFIRVSHFRRPFYVYSYAYGQLISKALAERVEEDPRYMDQVRSFLTAGSSKSPEAIFNDIGIKTRSQDIFLEGLRSIEEDVRRLKRLARKR